MGHEGEEVTLVWVEGEEAGEEESEWLRIREKLG